MPTSDPFTTPEDATSSPVTASPAAALRSSLTVDLAEVAAHPDSPVTADFAANPDLRRLLTADDASVWTIGGLGLIGFGRAANVVVTGDDRFTGARAWWDELTAGLSIVDPLSRSATGPVAFGAFAFARTSTAASGLVLPELVIGHDHDGAWVTLVSTAPELTIADVAEAWNRLVPTVLPAGAPEALAPDADTTSGPGSDPDSRSGSNPHAVEDEAAARTWCASVEEGVQLIRDGQLEKLVLARAVTVQGDGQPLDLTRALRRLAADYDTCWTYCVRIADHEDRHADTLFGATPERLVRVLDGTLHARVLAGTLDRASAPEGIPGSEWARRNLFEDPKQRAEHEFAIGSLLGSVAAYTEEVESSTDPFVLELPNVWHLASDVSADLTPGPDGTVPSALELVEAVHPTAAVCGTPTHEAAEAIARLEGLDRGLYAGPVGWLDSRHNGDFGIALRGGVRRTEDTAQVYAGCGVVEASVPAEELAETRAKLRPVLNALGVTPRS
ncbi:isochorismate synthase [Kocuria soli]|uniref:isochorismate synthase n=1 Tax=Kocuria soli TaxID=2485125 RepID=A0A3N3ZTA3_9MICC|nr:isochorismate synthase [Kocuria soli]ROZ65551.1 isochorismate synthase [Kocuria soli]